MIMKNLCLLLAAGVLSNAQSAYTYDSGGHLVKITYGSAGTVTYSYDAAGNLTGRSATTTTKSVITSVSTANGPSTIAQNTYIVVKGTNLVPATTPAAGAIWSTAPSFASGQMPTQLNGVSVTVNGKAAYVYFFCSAATSSVCASDQINILTPLDGTIGPVPIVVTSGSTSSAPFTVTMQTVVPSFLLFPNNYVAATHINGSLLGLTTLYPGASTPAQPGEEVVIYAVGFGLPSTPLSPGSAAQSGSLPSLPVCTIGSNQVSVAFAGLISPGLYQLNISIPQATSAGDQPISC